MLEHMRARPTLRDVAAAAGVGLATASRALSPNWNEHEVRPATRARILKAAADIGYRPSAMARALKTDSFRAVSVLLPPVLWAWWENAVQAATEEAEKDGYSVLAHALPTNITPGDAIRRLRHVPSEGIVIFGGADDEDVAAAARELSRPIVAIDDTSFITHIPTISVDNVGGAEMGTGHLIDSGRRNLLYIGYEPTFRFSEERFDGFQRAIAASPHDVAHRSLRSLNHGAALDTQPQVEALLDTSPLIDGIFCEADEHGPGLVRSLRRRGYAIPDDVAIVSFNGHAPARHTDPPLTSVRQPFEAIGEEAYRLVVSLIKGAEVPTVRRELTPELDLRASAPAVRSD